MIMENLVFLKLGGSLITDKTQPYTPLLDKLAQVSVEIKSALSQISGLNLILGHGSGSFGHYAVKEQSSLLSLSPSSLRQQTEPKGNYWNGFSEVWFQASRLNRIVMEALNKAAIPAVSFPPSALVYAKDGFIKKWDLTTLQASLNAGIMPVIYGDIVFDENRGGVVLSTEALLFHLAQQLPLKRVLLAGLEECVWADFPARHRSIEKIKPSSYDSISGKLGGSHGMDVTGGMRSKVEEMLRLVIQVPDLSVTIFSGMESGNIDKALRGGKIGTLITGDNE